MIIKIIESNIFAEVEESVTPIPNELRYPTSGGSLSNTTYNTPTTTTGTLLAGAAGGILTTWVNLTSNNTLYSNVQTKYQLEQTIKKIDSEIVDTWYLDTKKLKLTIETHKKFYSIIQKAVSTLSGQILCTGFSGKYDLQLDKNKQTLELISKAIPIGVTLSPKLADWFATYMTSRLLANDPKCICQVEPTQACDKTVEFQKLTISSSPASGYFTNLGGSVGTSIGTTICNSSASQLSMYTKSGIATSLSGLANTYNVCTSNNCNVYISNISDLESDE